VVIRNIDSFSRLRLKLTSNLNIQLFFIIIRIDASLQHFFILGDRRPMTETEAREFLILTIYYIFIIWLLARKRIYLFFIIYTRLCHQ